MRRIELTRWILRATLVLVFMLLATACDPPYYDSPVIDNNVGAVDFVGHDTKTFVFEIETDEDDPRFHFSTDSDLVSIEIVDASTKGGAQPVPTRRDNCVCTGQVEVEVTPLPDAAGGLLSVRWQAHITFASWDHESNNNKDFPISLAVVNIPESDANLLYQDVVEGTDLLRPIQIDVTVTDSEPVFLESFTNNRPTNDSDLGAYGPDGQVEFGEDGRFQLPLCVTPPCSSSYTLVTRTPYPTVRRLITTSPDSEATTTPIELFEASLQHESVESVPKSITGSSEDYEISISGRTVTDAPHNAVFLEFDMRYSSDGRVTPEGRVLPRPASIPIEDDGSWSFSMPETLSYGITTSAITFTVEAHVYATHGDIEDFQVTIVPAG